jgi:exosome complex component RRP45
MPREQEPPASQLEFILSALEDHIRIDGRELLQSREPVLEFGDELGWVECRFGKTRFVPSSILCEFEREGY